MAAGKNKTGKEKRPFREQDTCSHTRLRCAAPARVESMDRPQASDALVGADHI